MTRLLLALSLLLTGCHLTASQATLVEGAAEAACEALLPLATERIPTGANLGALDVWACRGAESALAAALAPAVATPPPAAPAGGSAPWGPGSARPLCAVRSEAGRMLGLAPVGVGLRSGYVCGALR